MAPYFNSRLAKCQSEKERDYREVGVGGYAQLFSILAWTVLSAALHVLEKFILLAELVLCVFACACVRA